MGNKQAKPRSSSNAAGGNTASSTTTSTSSKSQKLADTVPATQAGAPLPPPAPVGVIPGAAGGGKPPRALIESNLSQVDPSSIFTAQEIQAIRKHLAALLGQRETDAVVIPKEEFFRFLGTTSSSLYVNRLYGIFDMSGKGYVTFDDLIKGLSLLSQKASREQKLMLSFHLLDLEGTGYITKKMTTDLLRSCLSECRELDISLSDEQVARIVDNTFEEADLDRNQLVDLHEYQALDAKHPGLFDFLTVDAFGVLNHLEKVHSMGVVVPQ